MHGNEDIDLLRGKHLLGVKPLDLLVWRNPRYWLIDQVIQIDCRLGSSDQFTPDGFNHMFGNETEQARPAVGRLIFNDYNPGGELRYTGPADRQQTQINYRYRSSTVMHQAGDKVGRVREPVQTDQRDDFPYLAGGHGEMSAAYLKQKKQHRRSLEF